MMKQNHVNDPSPTSRQINNSDERHDDGATSEIDSSSYTCLDSEPTQSSSENCMNRDSCHCGINANNCEIQDRLAQSEISDTFADEKSQTDTSHPCSFIGSESSNFSHTNIEIDIVRTKITSKNVNVSNCEPSLNNDSRHNVMIFPYRESGVEYVPVSANPKKKAFMALCCGGNPGIKRLEKEIARLEALLIKELPPASGAVVKKIYASRKIIRTNLADAHAGFTKFDKLMDAQIQKSKLMKQQQVIDFITGQGKLFETIRTESEKIRSLMFDLRQIDDKPINLLEILHYLSQEGTSLMLENRLNQKKVNEQTIIHLQAMINNLRLVSGVATCKGDGVISVRKPHMAINHTSTSASNSFRIVGTNNNNKVWCLSQIHNEVKELKNNLRDIHKRILEYTGWPSDYMMQNHSSGVAFGGDTGKYYRLTSILDDEHDKDTISIVDSWRPDTVNNNQSTRTTASSDAYAPNLTTVFSNAEETPLTPRSGLGTSVNEQLMMAESSNGGSESSLLTPQTTFADENSCSTTKDRGEGMLKSGKLKRNVGLRLRLLGSQKKKQAAKFFRENKLKETTEDVCKLATLQESSPLLETSVESSSNEQENESTDNPDNVKETSDSSVGCTQVTPYEGENSFWELDFKPESTSATSLGCTPFRDSQENGVGTSMEANLSYVDDIEGTSNFNPRSCKTPTLADVNSNELDHIKTNTCAETEQTPAPQSVSAGSKSVADTRAVASKIMVELFGRKIEEWHDQDCSLKSSNSVGKLLENKTRRRDSNRGGRKSADGNFPQSGTIFELKSQIERIAKAQYSMIERVEFLESCFKKESSEET